MRLAFLVHKFKLLDKPNIRSYNDADGQIYQILSSFKELQSPKSEKPDNRGMIPTDLKQLCNRNRSQAMPSLDFVALMKYRRKVRVAEMPYIQPFLHMRRT
jgi:hypothetical protein